MSGGLLSLLAVLATVAAYSSAGSACWMASHQPELPEALKK